MKLFIALIEIMAPLTNIVAVLWSNLPLIIIAFLGLAFLIIFHELGHLLTAKLFNVYAPSFSIGFGPRIYEKQIGETTFALSAIPLGGYVELAGSAEVGQGEQKHAHDKTDRSFDKKPYWQKFTIMLGGIFANLLFSFIALSILFIYGAPCIGTWCEKKAAHIGVIHKGTPADKAGLKANDTIIAVNGVATPTIGDVAKQLEPLIGKETQLTIHRSLTDTTVTLTPESQTVGKKKKPLIGVAWQVPPMHFSESLSAGWEATWALISQTFEGFKNIIHTREGLGGPLMLISQATQFAGLGVKMFLFMLAFISINLAVLNLLPLPIFDGGQVLFFTIEAILRRPLSDEARYTIHYYTWIFILALVVYMTFKDFIKLSGWF
jgi:regulator of sigma E protease